MKYGRFFSDAEGEHRRPVVVIGEDVYKGLFASGDPTGKWIEVAGHMFEVIGVMPLEFAHRQGQAFIPLQEKLDPATRGNHFLAGVRSAHHLH